MEFAKPIPAHTLEPSALAAVEAVRHHGHKTRLSRVMASIVRDVGNPGTKPYPGDVVTSAARALEKLGAERGFDVQIVTLPDRCEVQGMRRADHLGFRATWTRGKADGGLWYAPWRYELYDDPRPVGVAKTRKTALANRRAAGVPQVHLRLVASPLGMKCNVTEIEKRVKNA